MTLKEMKLRVLSLIEEVNKESEYLTDDIDIQAKINYVIDSVMHELARFKKISDIYTIDVEENQDMNLYDELDNFYKLKIIKGVKCDVFEGNITFNESGTAKIYYYKYPKMITSETDDEEYKFELSDDALEIMPLGVAADLLKSDVSAQYGRIYADAYQRALSMLDTRTNEGQIEFIGGI